MRTRRSVSRGSSRPSAGVTRERSTVERALGQLKDEFGGRHVRVHGNKKVMCHLMFGVWAHTVDQMLRLVT